MPRTSRPITVTLGNLQKGVDKRVKSGTYSSASEVLRAAMRALDEQDAAVNAWLRQEIEKAFKDPRPSIPADVVFKRLRRRNARRTKAAE